MFSGFTPSPPYANMLHSKRFSPNYTFGTAAEITATVPNGALSGAGEGGYSGGED
jgi:hypothetical protein